jgi:type IX secretion system PorP/SprF family membrane protein
MMRTFLHIAIFIVAVLPATAQQQATYAQYMFNGLAINPAYAGSHNALSASMLARFQNVGLPGAPNTQTLSVHSPLPDGRMSVGMLFVNDKISVVGQTSVNGIYAYRLPMTVGSLSFGAQLGFSSYRAKYSQLVTYQQDALFAGDVRQVRPNFGFGMYYESDRWYAGASMPHMMNNIFDGRGQIVIHQSIPVIVTGGAMFRLSSVIQVKPNILFKWVDNRAVELDLNANFLFEEVLWVGVSYRFNRSVDWIAEVQVTDQFRIGYSYTTPFGPIRHAELGSHEIFLNYRFRVLTKGVVTPRSF